MKKIYLVVLFVLPILLSGQNIILKKTISNSNYPEIYWQTISTPDTSEFQIFRTGVNEDELTEIHTIHYSYQLEKTDTTEFVVIDTSLSKKGLYFYFILAKIGDKEIQSETAVANNFGLLPKPQIAFFKANPVEDRKAIQLNWKLNFNETVSSIALYRSSSYDTGYIKITDLSANAVSFTDVVTKSNEPWYYFMVINDYFGEQLPSVRIPAFATFTEKPIRPQNIIGTFSNDSIILQWKNTGHNIIGYRVYRGLEDQAFQLINEMAENIKKEAFFVDASLQIKTATRAKYYVRNLSDGFAESSSSDTLSFYITEHEPVLPPKELDFITNSDGSIKLLWVPPTDGLVIGYNIYINEKSIPPTKLNSQIITQNFFVDSVYRSEGKYIYTVEGVGINNKVSANKIVTTVNRYAPKIHVILDLKKQKDGIQISWKHPLNEQIAKLMLYKKYGQNKSVLKKTFPSNEDVIFFDTKVNRGTNYLYLLIAEMKNGDEIVINEGVEIIW